MVKLRDCRQQQAMLKAGTNPFTVVVMTHLKTQDMQRPPEERSQSKWAVTRRPDDLWLGCDDIIGLHRVDGS